MSLFLNRESHPQPAPQRKARRPEGVSRRRKKELGFETLEDRRVMSAQSVLAQLQGQVANGVSLNVQSYSSDTLEGQLAILQNELLWQSLMAAQASGIETQEYAIPTDPLLNMQWHLINSGQEVGSPDFQPIFGIPGEDINVGPVWNEGLTGEGVVVGVYELGAFQTTHPDLLANIDPTLSFVGTGTTGLSPHATAVAGLIGAVANNGIGGSGVAPGVTLVPMAGVSDASLGFRWALDNDIDIVNNSWGLAASRTAFAATPADLIALRDAVTFGRDNKGVVFVFASGNGAATGFNEGFTPKGTWDTATYDPYVNSRYTIGVTIVDHDGGWANDDGTFTSYGEVSTSILVASPSGSVYYDIGSDTGLGSGIVTSDLIGEAGYNQTGYVDDRDFLEDINYTSRFNGTSASTPIVSGVIALMLEANPNLTWRDVQEILVRSARQNSEFEVPEVVSQGATQNTWIINQMPVFHDPDTYDPSIDPFLLTTSPTLDPTLSFNGANANHYAPTPIVLTNGAGYTVSQGVTPYGENFGYAHGVVDAELAVKLAQQWHTKSQNLPSEKTFTTAVTPPEGGFFNLPAAEKGSQDSGYQLVPGGIGGSIGGGFVPYWNEYFVDDPDFTQDFGARGGYLELSVPENQSMTVDNVELKLSVAGDGSEFMNHVRVLLVSPNGTHSELNQFWVEPNIPYSLQNLSLATVGGEPNSLDPDGGNFVWTFNTNRNWGERSNDAIVFDPTTGEPSGDVQGWRLFIENYDSSNDFEIQGIELVWHGSPIAANTQRIQGVVGIDDNQDNAFNFSRVDLNVVDFDGDPTTLRYGEVINTVDLTHESMAENITVVARRASDGVVVDRFVTGADGNYYFDLVPDDYIISVEDPEGRVALEDTLSDPAVLQNFRTEWTITEEFFRVWDYDQNLRPAVDANGIPVALGGSTELYHVKDINFLLDPGPPALQQVQFSGIVAADFNGDGAMNGNDVGVPNVTVYADVNRNGQLDPGELSVQTTAGGQYTLTVPNTITTVINVGVIAPPNWTYADPASGFEPLFVEPGDVFTGVDFQLTPPVGTSAGDGSSQAGYLMGAVYEDVNNNGSRQATESGVSGIQVYVDYNNNGTREVNEPLTTTNANGAYVFGNIAPGTHRVRAIPVAPLVSINPGPGVPRIVNLAGGGTVSQIEFGIGLGSNPTAVFDYGDLPAAYGITLLSENGARHQKSAYYLGAAGVSSDIDVENDGKPSADAGKAGTSGDDQIGSDEQGIVVDPLIAGATGHLVATASRHGGVLQGWIDFNGDFVFQPDEKVISNVALVPGANDVYFQIPANLAAAASPTGGQIFARFRYGEYGINSVTGPALIGEVEDYLLDRDPSSLPAFVIHGPDFDEDGDVDGRDFLTLQRNWGRTNATPAQGDANGDGVVGYNDQVMWRNYYGTTAGSYAAFLADDDPPAAIVAVEEPLEEPIAAMLATDVEDTTVDDEEAPLIEAILIVDTTGPATVIEASAGASTAAAQPVDTGSVGLALELLSGDAGALVDTQDVVVAAADLDAAFDSSSELTDLGLALKKEESSTYRYDDDDVVDDSDEENLFELAFADEAEWLQL